MYEVSVKDSGLDGPFDRDGEGPAPIKAPIKAPTKLIFPIHVATEDLVGHVAKLHRLSIGYDQICRCLEFV